MPALKESSASLSAALQLPLVDDVSAPETTDEAATTVVASRKSRRRTCAAPWNEDSGVAAIVLNLISSLDG